MANGLIIPGVQVTVVKEVLPQQLTPSGVLGLVGFTEVTPNEVVRAGSWSRFVEALGRGSAYSLPEARQALDNGISELVISPLPADAGAVAEVELPADPSQADPKLGLGLRARTAGMSSNGLTVRIEYRANIDPKVRSFDLSLLRYTGGKEERLEVHRHQTPDTLIATLRADSAFLQVDAGKPLGWPAAGDALLEGGEDATAEQYGAALERLREESDVDLVLAAVQDFSDPIQVAQIYGQVISHCKTLSDECKGRIGFGQVPDSITVQQRARLANSLVSDRFVLVAPEGVVGAVAGRVGQLPYFHSPTFKQLSGVGALPALRVEEQKALLKASVVPVVLERGRGTIVLRGLTTDGDQINVRRVTDRAVRTLKRIGDLFIGLLNNADGRLALRQKLVEALVQMEREGALVRSADGREPAFTVEVSSSQEDFALGIVRVNLAVRPVRAIDYIYATLTVQV